MLTIIRSGVKIISKVTDKLKVSVTFQPWIGDNGKGTDEFGATVPVRPLVDFQTRPYTTDAGQTIATFGVLTFVDKINDTTPNAGKVRQQPIDPRDRFYLNGAYAPIADIKGPMDAGTNRGFIHEVTLGPINRGS